MSHTPVNLSHQKFKKVFFGFDASEVENYLDLVSSELNTLSRERQLLDDENEEYKRIVEEYREREKALKETMLAAQRVTEEMKSTAQREAELIIARAELSAERLLDEAQKRQTKLLLEINELKRRKVHVMSELRGHLHSHLQMLDFDKTSEPLLPLDHHDDEATDVGKTVNSVF
jgi:cell division initiation protein